MRRTGVWVSALAAFAILGGAGLVGVGMFRADGPGGVLPLTGTFDQPPTLTASPTPTGPTPEELERKRRATAVKSLNAALTSYARTVPEFSVAVLDKKTG